MPIYDISGVKRTGDASEGISEPIDASQQPHPTFNPIGIKQKRSSWLSSIIARLFFMALLILDIGWGVYSFCAYILSSVGAILSFGKIHFFQKMQNKFWLSIKRSLVCGLSLLTAIFSPAFGIMIACTYFLMYDKNGIEEVIPESLQDQFREFFTTPEK